MSRNPSVIGEGTYGCVHKPPLKCENRRTPKKNHISKVLYKLDARKELGEYSLISGIDKSNKFHLGKPIQCDLDDTDENENAIRKCTINGKKYADNMDELSLLIMKDGGKNIEDFAIMMKTGTSASGTSSSTSVSTDVSSSIIAHNFWIDVLSVLQGIEAFVEKGIVHHDLKPQNIVYNWEKRDMKMIDFGLMNKIEHVVDAAEKNKYQYDFLHWSFPIETLFYNKSTYNFYASRKNSAIQFYTNLIHNFQTSVKCHETDHLRIFFKYMSVKGYSAEYNNERIRRYVKDLFLFIANMDKMSHAEFMEMSVKTFDLYGLGIALACAFSETHKYLDEPLRDRLQEFIYSITTLNVSSRLTPNIAVAEYTRILEETEAFTKKDTKKAKDEPIPTSIRNQIDSIRLKNIAISKKEVEKVVNKDIRHCPEDKELNPATGRCNKMCKTGYVRNPKFKCVKAPKKQNTPLCPEGKELNPKTRRCNNVCKEGYIRNTDFKCVSNNKTVRVKNNTIKTRKARK